MSHLDNGAAPSAFESHLYPLLDSAYRTAMSLTRHRADAEDLLQDAALNALRGFGGFIPGTNFRAWFFRILRNAFLTRTRASWVVLGYGTLDDVTELPLAAGIAAWHQSSGDDSSVLARIASEQVASALAQLPEEHRSVATLYFIEERSYQEVADLLGIPLGTVRSRLHRARKALRSRLSRLAEDHGLIAA
ncbi:MAG: sigma-70 family RNA polymerase sigma factor [Gemmatimonadaceae bacterium]